MYKTVETTEKGRSVDQRITHDQSINQSINQSISQSVSQSINQSINQLITTRLNYCLSLYSGLPSVRLACIDRFYALQPDYGRNPNSVTYKLQAGGPSQLLSVRQYRVVSMVWRCQLGLTPTYLVDLCRPVSGTRSSAHRKGCCSQPRLPVPPSCRAAALVMWWPRRYGKPHSWATPPTYDTF